MTGRQQTKKKERKKTSSKLTATVRHQMYLHKDHPVSDSDYICQTIRQMKENYFLPAMQDQFQRLWADLSNAIMFSSPVVNIRRAEEPLGCVYR